MEVKTALTPRLSLSVTEAAASLGVSADFFRDHVLPEVRVVRRGRLKLVAVAELERWLASAGEHLTEDAR